MAELKIYEIEGKTFQYLPGEQPKGAKEISDKQVEKPADKQVEKPADKQAKPAANK